MLELERFLKENNNWEELLTNEPYNLKVKRDGNYVMLSYDQIRSDFSSVLVQQARGIIFKESTLEPVCVPFFKFFNFGEENAANIDWSTALVTEKIDGSLIKVWWDGDWKISTNGTIDAFKAELGDIHMPNFGEYFMKVINKYYGFFENFVESLNVDLTYMFELVGPYNRVVIPYEKSDVYLLGARNKYTGEEYYFCNDLIVGALGLGCFKRPKCYPLYSLNACIKAAEEFSWDQEGFVVVDAAGNRVKVKSPAYVLAHFMRDNNVINRKHLIRVILANEVEEFLCYASEYKEELLKVQRLMSAYHNICNQLAETYRVFIGQIPRSIYAKAVKTMPTIFSGFLFHSYDHEITAEEYTSNWSENKWESYLAAIEELGVKCFAKEVN